MKKYRVIYADPPWQYDTWGSRGHGAASDHYQTMSLRAIADLRVQNLLRDPAALFLWATGPKLEEALTIVEAWGFVYKTVAFTWKKCGGFGLGHYTRSETEFVLLGTHGVGMAKLRLSPSIGQFISASTPRHSQKPEAVAERIERLFPGPYLELFARRVRPGWDAWGNEVKDSGVVRL